MALLMSMSNCVPDEKCVAAKVSKFQILAVLCVLFVESLECTTLCKAVLLHKKRIIFSYSGDKIDECKQL